MAMDSEKLRYEGDDEGFDATASKEVFSSYQCRSLSLFPNARRHPGDIAEPASLAAVALPSTSYALSFPDGIIKDGVLSDLQLEGILYAATKHCHWLPGGQRAGFFIGDGAGVGKGRQIAGIILDLYCRGLTKSVWLSTSSDLYQDAVRDIKDLGSYIPVYNNLQSLDKSTVTPTEGCMFMTYSTLTAMFRGKRRLDQLIQWLGGSSFSGVVIFDEAHKAKHHAIKETQGTKVAASVVELQEAMPSARIVYASATGVSEVANMAYLTRLGLFGPGTAFSTSDDFITSLQRKGINFLEQLAMDLKSQGFYVARGLSFRSAEFMELEIGLTDAQIALYDAAVAIWADLREAIHRAWAAFGDASTDPWKPFWAAQQRFFKTLCISLKVPAIVEHVRTAVEDGYAVIIGLQSTGEAAADFFTSRSGEICDFVSVCREIIVKFIFNHFPLGEGRADEAPDNHLSDAKNQSRPVAELVCEETRQELLEIRYELLNRVESLGLPPNFLDELIDRLGGKKAVAEMTGRKGRIVRDATGRLTYEFRAKPESYEMESLNIKEKDAFMEGRKLIAIISDAASTGISLHSSATAVNQRRRMHFTIELPWSADKAIQQLGRSHRSNQTSAPCYKLVFTDIGGERRFAAAVAKRLQSLGALTRGDRRAASGLDVSSFNFDSHHGRRALRRMFDHFVGCSAILPPGVRLEDLLEGLPESEARKFLPKSDANGFLSAAAVVDAIQALHIELCQHIEAMGIAITAVDETSGATKPSSNTNRAGRDVGDVRKFLNRLLAVPVFNQKLLFNYFQRCLDSEIAAAKASGSYIEAVSDIPAQHIQYMGPAHCVWTDPASNRTTYQHDIIIDRGVSLEVALRRLQVESRAGDSSAFYLSRRLFSSSERPSVLLALQVPGSSSSFTIIRPNTGESPVEMDYLELSRKYTPCDVEEAKNVWEESYEFAGLCCSHGPGCGRGQECQVGRRHVKITLLTGSLVGIWDSLELVLKRNEHELSKVERMMRIIRIENAPPPMPRETICDSEGCGAASLVMANDNLHGNIKTPKMPLIGLRYPGRLLSEVIDLLKESSRMQQSCSSQQKERLESPLPVNQKAKRRAFTAPKTVKDYFKPRQTVSCRRVYVNKDNERNSTGQRTSPQVSPAEQTSQLCGDKRQKSECGELPESFERTETSNAQKRQKEISDASISVDLSKDSVEENTGSYRASDDVIDMCATVNGERIRGSGEAVVRDDQAAIAVDPLTTSECLQPAACISQYDNASVLLDMGFGIATVQRALWMTRGNVEAALDRLLSGLD